MPRACRQQVRSVTLKLPLVLRFRGDNSATGGRQRRLSGRRNGCLIRLLAPGHRIPNAVCLKPRSRLTGGRGGHRRARLSVPAAGRLGNRGAHAPPLHRHRLGAKCWAHRPPTAGPRLAVLPARPMDAERLYAGTASTAASRADARPGAYGQGSPMRDDAIYASSAGVRHGVLGPLSG